MRLSFLFPLFAASSLSAAECPASRDITAALADLFTEAHQMQDPTRARQLSARMWELWADAPDDVAQNLLDQGMDQRAAWDLRGASESFDRLVAYCPNYAEGYNQRAFVNFLREDFFSALPDLDRAISLQPNHVAAISGRALTLLALGRPEEARADLARALALNPWIPERGLAAPGGPLAPVETDI